MLAQIYLSMTNNCVAVEETEIAERPDAEAGSPPLSLADSFAAWLAQCKVEAECLDNSCWEELPSREKVARLLAMAGKQAKGIRFRDCYVTAIPVDCISCGKKYYSRYRCTLRYCEQCGVLHFSRLMEKYREPISHLISEQPSQRGRTLAKLNFTVRAYDRIPDRDQPRLLMKLVRRWFKRMMPTGTLWGCIFAVETGHELAVKHPGRSADGWNLHVHVLYYGCFVDWQRGLDLWRELTGGEGQGFYVKQCEGWRKNPEQAVRRALIHHFGYIMKPAAVSPERIAALEILFSGVRRVHALGSFYRLPARKKVLDCPKCPECGGQLPINLRAWHRSERRPVASLEAEGRRDYRAVASAVRRARVFGARAPCASHSWESLYQ